MRITINQSDREMYILTIFVLYIIAVIKCFDKYVHNHQVILT